MWNNYMVHTEIPDYTMQVKEILQRKKSGMDCSEEESGLLKQWVKNTVILPGSGDVQILEDIQALFICEYSEAFEEQERDELIKKVIAKHPNVNPDFLAQLNDTYIKQYYLEDMY